MCGHQIFMELELETALSVVYVGPGIQAQVLLESS